MNEKGFGVNLLWLGSSDYGARDAQRPGLSMSLWAQYFLDNFATVEEAVRQNNTEPIMFAFQDYYRTTAAPRRRLTPTSCMT